MYNSEYLPPVMGVGKHFYDYKSNNWRSNSWCSLKLTFFTGRLQNDAIANMFRTTRSVVRLNILERGSRVFTESQSTNNGCYTTMVGTPNQFSVLILGDVQLQWEYLFNISFFFISYYFCFIFQYFIPEKCVGNQNLYCTKWRPTNQVFYYAN